MLRAARTLESQLAARDVHPSAEFADRVMAAVAAEPRPQPAVAAGLATRRGRLRSMSAALADSWRVKRRPPRWPSDAGRRVVLVAILALGSLGSLAAAGAIRLLAPAPSPGSALPTIRSDGSTAPTAQPTPTATLPTPSAGPTDDGQPTGSPEPSETDDSGKAPEATKTPRPTNTPRGTVQPTETEDPTDDSGHGGGGSGDEGESSTPHP